MEQDRQTRGQSEVLERVAQFDYFQEERFLGHQTAYTSSWTLRETYYYVCLLQHFKWAFEQGENRFSLRVYAKLSAVMRTKSRLQIKKHHETLIKQYQSVDAIIEKELQVIHNSIGDNERALRKMRQIETEVSTLDIVRNEEVMADKWQQRKKKREEKLGLTLFSKEYEEFQNLVGAKLEELGVVPKGPKGQMTYSCWNYYEDYIYYCYMRKNANRFIDSKVPKNWFFYNYVSFMVKTKSRHQVFHHHYELLRLCGNVPQLIRYLSYNVLDYARRKPQQIKEFKMLEEYVDQFMVKEGNIRSFSLEQQRKYMTSRSLYEKMLAKRQTAQQNMKKEDDMGVQQCENKDSEEEQQEESEEDSESREREKEEREREMKRLQARRRREQRKKMRQLDEQVACWQKHLQTLNGEVKIQQDY